MRYHLSATQRIEMRRVKKAAALESAITFFTGTGAPKRIASFAWEALTTAIIWCSVLVAMDIVVAEFGLLTGSSQGTIAEVAAKALHETHMWKNVIVAGGVALALRVADIVLPAMKKAQQTYVSSLANNSK